MEGSNEELNPNAIDRRTNGRAVLQVAYGEGFRSPRFEADIEAGAPTNADGRLNLLTYTAWMLKEAGRGE